jgi:hypothetical protein
MNLTPSPASRRDILRAFEPLWVGALGIQFVAGGAVLLPRLIRLMGRGGAVETVEWAVYMSMLFVFPLAVLLGGWIVPRVLGDTAASWLKRALVLLVAVEFVAYVVLAGAVVPAFSAVIAAAAGAGLLGILSRDRISDRAALAVVLCCGIAGWMAGGGLVYWTGAPRWLASPVPAIVLIASAVVCAYALRAWIGAESPGVKSLRIFDLPPLAALIAFSFRTHPVVEFYHWGFFVGPIEQLRQGGTLLWDTPSQYGFLSILLPAALPGSAWQSFWFFQAVTYAVVACLMYLAIRRLSAGWPTAVVAFVFTFTSLFFRPRNDYLILPAQMTPAAGPFRFIWCFVMMAFLIRAVSAGIANQRRFAAIGTLIWILAVLWSAETAIYVTAMWFPALLVCALQGDSGSSMGARFATALRTAGYPAVALAVAWIAIIGGYRLAGRPGPDISGHFEYVLLYSRGGFGALPIDPSGTIWYLVVVFLIASTVVALHALRNPRDPRLIVWTAAWGGLWAVSSYFTGRSHPVNLIALIPILVYMLVGTLRMNPFGHSLCGRWATASVVLPLLVMPVVATAGHRGFAAALFEDQLTIDTFKYQVPGMGRELQSVLVAAGARPGDSFVLASDGRLMLGAWKVNGTPIIPERSWLPKAFEIIGSLPEHRRQVYFERNALAFPEQGWLIQHRTLAGNGTDHLLRFVESSRAELKRFESPNWIVRLMGPVRTGGT